MKLLTGSIAYLAFTAAVAAATVAGLASLERGQPDQATAVAKPSVTAGNVSDRSAVKRAPAREAALSDDDRVPVWIVPTAKYEYTPVPIDPRPKRPPQVIGQDARAAMARVRTQPGEDGRRAIERAMGDSGDRGVRALGFTRSRDNDPFYRD